MSEENKAILKAEGLTKIFSSGIINKEYTVAVNNASFELYPGKVTSLVGESGSGKTTVGRLILKLIEPTAGKIFFKGQDITDIEDRDTKKEYYRQIQGVFQDPFSSFNPLFKINRIFDILFREFEPETKNREELISQSLEEVNLNPDRILDKYPHQLSGGQLQRLLIARALLLDVDILVADEIISMLDASTKMGVLNLLVDICRDKGMAVLFITHDLNLGYYLSDDTLILHEGNLVERGATTKVYENPYHPYTQMLFDSVPDIEEKWDRSKEFIPEQIIEAVEEFYQNNDEEGYKEVEENHFVLMSILETENYK